MTIYTPKILGYCYLTVIILKILGIENGPFKEFMVKSSGKALNS